jgi:hypothetical protein
VERRARKKPKVRGVPVRATSAHNAGNEAGKRLVAVSRSRVPTKAVTSIPVALLAAALAIT